MTSPISAVTKRCACRRRQGGFTLVELLVVIGIMVVLMGLLAPMVMGTWRAANRTKMAADLAAISTALDARKADWGDYPRVQGAPLAINNGYDGAIALCQALIGPSDADDLDDDDGNGNMLTGAERNDMGFRRRPGGKPTNPYLNLDRFKMQELDGTTDDPQRFLLLDHYEKPILYFPASAAKLNVRVVAGSYAGQNDNARFDLNDNIKPLEQATPDPLLLQRFRLLLRDYNANGMIDGAEVPVDAGFVLWCAGPDDLFGPKAEETSPDDVLNDLDAKKCDDVTNF